MIVHVKVKPSSNKQEIESFGNDRYLIYLKSSPEDDRANIELINMLSKYFGIPVGRIRIKTGRHDNNKTIELS